MIKGHIHSVESMGTVDGPGLRYILFTQGCLLRCLYCHNPDTWKINEPSREVTVDEMVNEILPYQPYFDASGGGVTVSGGEPLLQMPFLEALFKSLKAYGIHTCIDTSAGCANDTIAFNRHFDTLQQYTDLILLDIKHIDNDKHMALTGRPNTHILKFAQKLSDNVEKFEILPYHQLGVHKWKTLGVHYQLEDVDPPDEEAVMAAYRYVNFKGKIPVQL